MKSLLLRQFTPALVIILVVMAVIIALVFVALTFPSGSNSCGPKSSVCLNPLALRYLIGGILLAGVPLNLWELITVVIAAARPPVSTAMDERIQHFLVSTIASICFGIVGFYLIFPEIQRGGLVVAVALLLGMTVYSAKPLIFLWNLWRLRRR